MAIPPVGVEVDSRTSPALDTWRVYKRWASMSRRQKERRDRQKRVAFWLVIVAVVVGPFATRPAGPMSPPTSAREWALLAATAILGVAVALGAFFSEKILGPKPDQEWVRAREGAEGLKSLVFEFVAGVPPFDGADAVTRLMQRREQIENRLIDLIAPEIPAPQAEQEFPGCPLPIDGYVDTRLVHQRTGQLTWFESRVSENLRRAERLEVAVKVLAGIGVVLAVLGPLGVPWVGGWTPILTAVASALTAQLSAGRFRFLCRSYQNAAARLRRSLTAWRSSERRAEDGARLVAESEATLREEQARWVQEMIDAGPQPAASMGRVVSNPVGQLQ